MQLPVHSGGNRLGISPNFPCHPQWAPATVQPDDVELNQRLLNYKEQFVDEATTLCLTTSACQDTNLQGHTEGVR